MKVFPIAVILLFISLNCTSEQETTDTPIKGLRTVIYVVPDLNAAKQWYTDAFNIKPYFDEPFYVGFDINGYELGLDPDTSIIKPGQGGSVVYWKVADIQAVHDHMLDIGATSLSPVENVGVMVASVVDPFGNIIGLIQE